MRTLKLIPFLMLFSFLAQAQTSGYAGLPCKFKVGTSCVTSAVAGTNITLTVLNHIVTISASGGSSSPLTTKGDLFGFSTVAARVPVGADGTVLSADSTQATGVKWISVGGTGTVTSVGLTSPGVVYTVSGSPVTTSGTLALNLISQNNNQFLAGPTSGGPLAPTFRSIATGDLPAIPLTTGVTGVLPLANGGTNTGTALTQGSVHFAGPSGSFAQDNSKFFWDNTNFRLGLGTATPAFPLDVLVSTTSASQAIQSTAYGVNSMGYRNLKAEGTVGSPTAVLNDELLNFVSARGYGTTGFPTGATGAYQIAAEATFTDSSMPTDLRMLTTPVGSVTSAERMRITPAGNVLINTTTDDASHSLQVNGTILGTGATFSGLTASSNVFTDASKNLTSTGTVSIAQGGTGASSTSQNFAFIGPTSGSGAPSFRALVSGDIVPINLASTANGGITGVLGPANGGRFTSVYNVYTGSTTMADPGVGCQNLRVRIIGGGAGGGSGGVGSNATAHSGGSGGSAGTYYDVQFQYSAVGAWPVTITIGASAAGGTATSGAGNNGTAGNNTSFGSIVVAVGGAAGQGGSTNAGSNVGGIVRYGSTPGGVLATTTGAQYCGGQSGSSATSIGSGGSGYAGCGGGGGGCSSASCAAFAPGVGGTNFNGATPAAAGANGTAGDNSAPYIGFGGVGGGGGAVTAGGGTAQNGGNGGLYGAGGGGGSATVTGTNSGAGGSGSQGLMIVSCE